MSNTFSVPARRPGLVSRTMHEGFEVDVPTNIEGAHPLRRVHLVSRDAQEIDPESFHIDGNLSDRLWQRPHETAPPFPGDGRNGCHGLNRPHFIVGMHDANQHRVTSECATYVVGVDEAGGIDRNPGDSRTEALQKAARFKDGRVFDRRRDDLRRAGPPAQCWLEGLP